MKEILRQGKSFNDHIVFLKDSISILSEYWNKIGKRHPYIKDIQEGLNHSDPFIIYKACIAASLLLEDRRIYH